MKDENHRAQLLVMAETWETLAEDREKRAQGSGTRLAGPGGIARDGAEAATPAIATVRT